MKGKRRRPPHISNLLGGESGRKVGFLGPRGISARLGPARPVSIAARDKILKERAGVVEETCRELIQSKFLPSPPFSTPVYGFTALGWHFREIHERPQTLLATYKYEPIVRY